jgi:hypothetical protein
VTAAAASLPTTTGPVTVSFKHESDVDGTAVGPVVVIEREPYDAWLKKHGIPRVNARGETRYSCLFGSEPAGKHALGWMTKGAAREVAVHYGVALEEF